MFRFCFFFKKRYRSVLDINYSVERRKVKVFEFFPETQIIPQTTVFHAQFELCSMTCIIFSCSQFYIKTHKAECTKIKELSCLSSFLLLQNRSITTVEKNVFFVKRPMLQIWCIRTNHRMRPVEFFFDIGVCTNVHAYFQIVCNDLIKLH